MSRNVVRALPPAVLLIGLALLPWPAVPAGATITAITPAGATVVGGSAVTATVTVESDSQATLTAQAPPPLAVSFSPSSGGPGTWSSTMTVATNAAVPSEYVVTVNEVAFGGGDSASFRITVVAPTTTSSTTTTTTSTTTTTVPEPTTSTTVPVAAPPVDKKTTTTTTTTTLAVLGTTLTTEPAAPDPPVTTEPPSVPSTTAAAAAQAGPTGGDSGSRLVLWLLGAAIAIAAGGAVLWFTRWRRPDPATPTCPACRRSLTPQRLLSTEPLLDGDGLDRPPTVEMACRHCGLHYAIDVPSLEPDLLE